MLNTTVFGSPLYTGSIFTFFVSFTSKFYLFSKIPFFLCVCLFGSIIQLLFCDTKHCQLTGKLKRSMVPLPQNWTSAHVCLSSRVSVGFKISKEGKKYIFVQDFNVHFIIRLKYNNHPNTKHPKTDNIWKPNCYLSGHYF